METETVKKRRGWKKALALFIALAIIALGVFFYIRYYYVFGEGVKSGQLNYVVYKGVIFKTYEGKLIQSGFRGSKPGAIQSYEFEFSVTNKDIAERLMRAGGKNVELHYKEYFKPIPWRGYSAYIVDSIVSIQNSPQSVWPD